MAIVTIGPYTTIIGLLRQPAMQLLNSGGGEFFGRGGNVWYSNRSAFSDSRELVEKKCDTTEAGGIVQERNVKRPESIAGLAMDLSLNGLVKRSVNCSNFKMFSRSKCHKISVWRDFADDRLAVIDSAGRGDFK